MEPHQFVEKHDGLNNVGRIRTHGTPFGAAIAGIASHRPRRVRRIAPLVVLDQRVGAQDRRLQVFRIASHLVQPKVSVPILADHMGFHIVLPVRTPAAIARDPRIGRWVWHLCPRIIRGSAAVLQLIIDEVLEHGHGTRISRIRVKTLHKTLHHCSKISRRVCPFLIGNQLVGRAIEVEATVKVVESLPVVLIPEDGPLRKNMRRVGIANVVGHRPGK